MDELEILRSELNKVSVLLDEMEEESIPQNIEEISKIAEFLHTRRNDFINAKSKEGTKNFHIEFEPLIKQINIKFDNVINRIKLEQNDISKELNNIQNQKKLANYHR